jgi:hypothetical protein
MRFPVLLATALLVGFLAFVMTAKWSIYASRYYIPLLVAWCPLIALALSRLPKVVVRGVCLAIVVVSVPLVLSNYQRPLLHPVAFRSAIDSYFVTAGTTEAMESKADAYQRLAEALAASSCHEVGIANQVVVEYPIWIALDKVGWKGEIEHVDVQNVSSRIVERRDFQPCALIYQPDQRNFREDHPRMREETFGNLTMFIEEDRVN